MSKFIKMGKESDVVREEAVTATDLGQALNEIFRDIHIILASSGLVGDELHMLEQDIYTDIIMPKLRLAFVESIEALFLTGRMPYDPNKTREWLKKERRYSLINKNDNEDRNVKFYTKWQCGFYERADFTPPKFTGKMVDYELENERIMNNVSNQ